MYAVDYEYHHTMSWRNRLRRWTRWQTSIGKVDSKPRGTDEKGWEQLEEVKSSFTPTHHKAKKRNEKEIKQYELQESNLWSTTPVTSTMATVGHVLHQTFPSSGIVDVLKPVRFDVKEADNSRTLFVPSTKNLSRLIEGMSSSTLPSSTLTMKFLPSPWFSQKERPSSSFPALEMRFDISGTMENNFNLTNMVAITEDICNDVMLPVKALDIRFRQKTCFPFIAANLEAYPQIARFIEASQLGQRVNIMTPPELVVPIPNFMCSQKSTTDATNGTSTDVRYLFAGLTYRTQIKYDFQDWCLQYTSVNSGKADGRCAELSLIPAHKNLNELEPSKVKPVFDEDLFADYIRSVYFLVDKLGNLDQVDTREAALSREVKTPLIKHWHAPSFDHGGAQKQTDIAGNFTYFPKSIDFRGEFDNAT